MACAVRAVLRSVSVGSEELGSAASFTAVLTTPGVAVDSQALTQAAGGSAELAEAVAVVLASR